MVSADTPPVPCTWRTGAGRHEWLVEFERPPADETRSAVVLTESCATELRSRCEATADPGPVFPLVKTPRRPARSVRWMKERGAPGGQHKVPRLSNDRTYLDAPRSRTPGCTAHLPPGRRPAARAIGPAARAGGRIKGTFDTFTTDELGNVYAPRAMSSRSGTRTGAAFRNSLKTFGRITLIDAFYS